MHRRFVAIAMAGGILPLSIWTMPAFAAADPSSRSAVQADDALATRFAPSTSSEDVRIDYTAWDEALRYFVFHMGPSERRFMSRVEPETGTRDIKGHNSGLRLEGNRVAFSFLEDQHREALTAYRQELEALGGQLDITALPRNEQLAYWLNLHNVAVIEQIALAYPLSQPSKLKVGEEGELLDEAKFLHVGGTALSLKDIRTRIVYPNWKDPRVIYGFFRGEIGGPTIQRTAFNADNLNLLLHSSAIDFVNSMRGIEKRGKTLHVSRLFEEAMPFYFAQDGALRTHLEKFASEKVRAEIVRTSEIRPSIYEYDISDLAKGDRVPEYQEVGQILDPYGFGVDSLLPRYKPLGVPIHIARVVEEKVDKLNRMRKNGELRGRVYFIDPNDPSATAIGSEIE